MTTDKELTDTKPAEMTTLNEALAAWERNGPTSLTVALMADALYTARVELTKMRLLREAAAEARDDLKDELLTVRLERDRYRDSNHLKCIGDLAKQREQIAYAIEINATVQYTGSFVNPALDAALDAARIVREWGAR